MPDHYRQFAIAIPLHGKLAAAWVTETLRARRRQRQRLADHGFYDAADKVGADFTWKIDDGCLRIANDSGIGKIEHAAEFLRELMRFGYVRGPIAIYWVDTRLKTRPDEFTGGAAIVTRKRLHWFVLPEIVERKLRAIERREQA